MTLHTKIGGRETNSFITIVEADAIMLRLPDDDTTWKVLTDIEKEYRLTLATNLMGMLPWRGFRVYNGQAVVFPRSSQGLDVRVIPDAIKDAQAQIAFSVVHRALLERPTVAEGSGDTKVRKVSLGGLLSVTFDDKTEKGVSSFDRFLRTVHWPIFMLLLPWLAQVRGRIILNADEEITLSTTTTTTSTTSTTSTSTTSTTVTTTTTTSTTTTTVSTTTTTTT